MRRTRVWLASASIAAVMAFAPTALTAQAKPANATAQCKDGTYSTAKTKRGACSGHGGVQTWFADTGGAKSDAKAAGSAAKAAAKDAGEATKDAAKATGKAVSGAADAAANAIKPRPSDAPKDATAKCKDGTYSMAKQHRGACSNHGGVADWYK